MLYLFNAVKLALHFNSIDTLREKAGELAIILVNLLPRITVTFDRRDLYRCTGVTKVKWNRWETQVGLICELLQTYVQWYMLNESWYMLNESLYALIK